MMINFYIVFFSFVFIDDDEIFDRIVEVINIDNFVFFYI